MRVECLKRQGKKAVVGGYGMARVVVVGGGFTGAKVAKELEHEFEVVLIDTKDYFEFTPGILRTIVEPQHAKHIQVLHTDYLERAQVKNEQVVSVDKTYVHTTNALYVYDYVVVCTGSDYNLPIKEQGIVMGNRLSSLRNCHEELERADTTLLIGGGIVGVELAAEIADVYPEKGITLVHSHDRLMPRRSARSQTYAKQYLERIGVTAVFNERITSHNGNGSFTTDAGRQLTADIPFLCTGISPNSAFLEDCFPEQLDEKGFLRVNTHLQVEGTSRLFAGGDVTNLPEEKTAQCAEHHAAIIAENIRRTEAGEVLQEYQASSVPMVISLGKWDGIFEHNGRVLTGILPALMKRFIEWKTMRRYR